MKEEEKTASGWENQVRLPRIRPWNKPASAAEISKARDWGLAGERTYEANSLSKNMMVEPPRASSWRSQLGRNTAPVQRQGLTLGDKLGVEGKRRHWIWQSVGSHWKLLHREGGSTHYIFTNMFVLCLLPSKGLFPFGSSWNISNVILPLWKQNKSIFSILTASYRLITISQVHFFSPQPIAFHFAQCPSHCTAPHCCMDLFQSLVSTICFRS